VRGARRSAGYGDFWGHLLVARGSADVMLEPELSVWDWAAVSIIVRVRRFGSPWYRALFAAARHVGEITAPMRALRARPDPSRAR
jgi:hypothetical protein